jgi:hypothetical protein
MNLATLLAYLARSRGNVLAIVAMLAAVRPWQH